MGITWAIFWAVAGLMIGVASILLPWLPWNLFFDVFDAPLPAMAVPGFFGGFCFSIVLGIAGRNRKFEDLSMRRFAMWGGLGGLMLSAIPLGLLLFGMLSGSGGYVRLLQALLVVTGPFVVFGAASAAASLRLARRAERQLTAGPSPGSHRPG